MGTSGGEPAEPRLWGVIVTYRRAEVLRQTMRRIEDQTKPVDILIVVDNGSEHQVQRIADSVGAHYIDAGDNLGPAGGIALGMEYVLDLAAEDDWLIIFDDDDPPRTDAMVADVWEFGRRCHQDDPKTGAVGLVGARYDRRRGVIHRVPDGELTGSVLVDYIGGGQLPMYRCAALRDAGVFDKSLFFGFADLDHGLRMREAGFSLYVDGELWLQERAANSRVGLTARPRTSEATAGWRRYYSIRNSAIVAKRHASVPGALVTAFGGAARATGDLVRRRQPPRECLLPLRGAIDGLLGRTGRVVEPGSAAKTIT